MQSSFSAVIYDMDGVLIDSEMHWDTIINAFFEKRGVPYTASLKTHVMGRGVRQIVEWAKTMYGWSDSVETLLTEYIALSDIIYDTHAAPMPGVTAALQRIKEKGYKTSIGSGSSLSRIEKIVDRFGWQKYFDSLISSDHVNGVGKPAPDIYLHAAKTLDVLPSTCLVIEDSSNGVRSAKAAGMMCIAMPDPRWSHGDFSLADYIVQGFPDPSFYSLLNLS